MSTVHFVSCRSSDEAEYIGRLALALFDQTTVGTKWADTGTSVALHLETPLRLEAQKQFLAWTEPLETRIRQRQGPVALAVGAPEGTPLALVTIGSLHARSGWEGALHALGLRCVSEQSVASITESVQPHVERDICGGCGMCVTLCGNDGILHNGHVAVVKPETCLACGDCLAECYLEALKFPDRGTGALMQRVASSAARVVEKSGEVVTVVFLLQGPRRKLASDGNHVPQADLGILVGTDPVAVDQAAVDLISGASGQNLQELSGCPDNPLDLITDSEKKGAGNRFYELFRHTPDRLGC